MKPYDILPCTPDYTAYKQVFKNWTPLIDQGMDLQTALAESCDTYFYELGQRFYNLPADRGHPLQAWANRFGLGESSGIDVRPEVSGLMPTPEWRRKHYPQEPGLHGEVDRTWKPGYSIQLAIGQGQVLVTPLQMTRFYAMIANGGKLVTPHIADDVELTGNDGQPVRILRRSAPSRRSPRVSIRPRCTYVQRGLDEATHASFGTSSGVFGNFPVDIAGKTGSAEKNITLPGYPNPVNLTQSWWCGYGPYAAPSIVVCAVIENGGHGGTAAAPAALKVFEQYFNTSAHNHDPRERLMSIEAVDTRARGLRDRREARGRRRDRAALPPRLDPAGGVRGARRVTASGRSTGSRCTTPAAPRSRARLLYASRRRGALRRRPAHRSRRGIAMRGARSTSARSAVMLFVLAAGAATRGSRRWIDVGFFTFQPSEFGKVLFVLALAGLRRRPRAVASRARAPCSRIIGFGLAPIVLVFIQPDIGTALVYAAALAAVLFVAGVRWLHLGDPRR